MSLFIIQLQRVLGAQVPPHLVTGCHPRSQGIFELNKVEADVVEAALASTASYIRVAPEEKAIRVKKTAKMLQIFGEAPPFSAYLHLASFQKPTTKESHQTLAFGTYRQSILSLQYMVEHDRASLDTFLDDLDQPSGGKRDDDLFFYVDQTVKESKATQGQLEAEAEFEDNESTISEPTSPSETEKFMQRRKRASKISAFFGDPRVGSQHAAASTSSRTHMLDQMLANIEEGAEQDRQLGLLRDEDLLQVKNHMSSLKRTLSTTKA